MVVPLVGQAKSNKQMLCPRQKRNTWLFGWNNRRRNYDRQLESPQTDIVNNENETTCFDEEDDNYAVCESENYTNSNFVEEMPATCKWTDLSTWQNVSHTSDKLIEWLKTSDSGVTVHILPIFSQQTNEQNGRPNRNRQRFGRFVTKGVGTGFFNGPKLIRWI